MWITKQFLPFIFYFVSFINPPPLPPTPYLHPKPLPPTLYLRLFIVGAAKGGERRLAEGETLNPKP